MKHKWKQVISWSPGEPTEQFVVCEDCGAEMDDDNEDEECPGDEYA